jgi:hypothetical protein
MKNLDGLRGRAATPQEIESLTQTLGVLPAPLLAALSTLPIIGLRFSLSEDVDESSLGADFLWMTPREMLEEATGAYPGIVAIKEGLFPVGICLEGTGDPYFYRRDDGAVVRVPHGAATETSLDAQQVEVVASSIENLVELSRVHPAGLNI